MVNKNYKEEEYHHSSGNFVLKTQSVSQYLASGVHHRLRFCMKTCLGPRLFDKAIIVVEANQKMRESNHK